MEKFLTIAAAGVLLLGGGAARAAVIPASSGSPADVLAAVQAASPGDTVQLPAGSFSWSAAPTIVIATPLTLQGGGGVPGMATTLTGANFLLAPPAVVTFDHLELVGPTTGTGIGATAVAAIYSPQQTAARLVQSTITGYADGILVLGAAAIVNSTLSGNGAAVEALEGTVGFFQSTVADNDSGVFGPRFNVTVQVSNSVFGHNTNADLNGNPSAYQLVGANVIQNPGIVTLGAGTIVADPRVGALASYGGGTRTQALLDDSPALGVLSGAAAVDDQGNVLLVDQRDVQRGSATSLGAFGATDPVAALAALQSATATNADVLSAKLDALQSSASFSQAAEHAILTDLNGVNFGLLDAAVSTRASQGSVDALAAGVSGLSAGISGLSTGNLDVKVSSRASGQQADDIFRLKVEQLLAAAAPPTVFLSLPAASGGRLEFVQWVVEQSFADVQSAGSVVSAEAARLLAAANQAIAEGRYRRAYGLYGQAYRALP